MRKFLGLFIFTLLSTSLAFAGQNTEVTHDDIRSGAVVSSSSTSGNSYYRVGCGSRNSNAGFFSDRDGNHKPYANDSDYYTTICPAEGNRVVTTDFLQVNIEKFDKLSVWTETRSGAVTAGNTPEDRDVIRGGSRRFTDGVQFLAELTGNTSPGVLTSRVGWCLTFRFESDNSVVKNGWYARIDCDGPFAGGGCGLDRYVEASIDCGETIKGDNFGGENRFENYGSCSAWPSTGRELIYKFVNHKVRDLTFTLKEDDGGQPKVLNMYILNGCSLNSCVGAINRPSDPDSDRSRTIYSAAPGTYYVVIDANQEFGHNWFELSLHCDAAPSADACDDAYYSTSFERFDFGSTDQTRFRNGDYVSIVSPYWTKSEGLRHARVSSDVAVKDGVQIRRAADGRQALEFNRADEGAQNAILNLGQKYRGKYRICWSMFIEKKHTAFFGLFGTDGDPWGAVSKEFAHNSELQGKWFDVELFVDLDNNRYSLFLNNRQYSSSGAYNLNLDALMFYGTPNAHFYVDAICFSQVRRIPSARVAALDDTPLFTADVQLQAVNGIQGITDNGLTQLATATTNELTATDLKVVPNPTSGATTIALDLATAQNVELQIFSPAGQMVREISLGETSIVRQDINLGDLPNGLYILKATAEQSVITKKIVLQK